jgi:hypothetical protein
MFFVRNEMRNDLGHDSHAVDRPDLLGVQVRDDFGPLEAETTVGSARETAPGAAL